MEIKKPDSLDTGQKQVAESLKNEKIQRIYVPVFSLLIAILMTISIIVVMSFA